MEVLRTCMLVGATLMLLAWCADAELGSAPPPPPPAPPALRLRRQYKVNDAESAASDWSHERDTRAKRHHHHGGGGGGVTGPIHTFVKTDKHANFKWGVRHHVGHKYS